MAETIITTLRSIKLDGLPAKQHREDNHLLFLFDGCVVSGWPLLGCENKTAELGRDYIESDWEANSDVGKGSVFCGVEYYLLIPKGALYLQNGIKW